MKRANPISQEEMQQLSAYCEKLTAPAARHNISYGCKTRRSSVVIEATRPAMLGKKGTHTEAIAKLVKNRETQVWELLWLDGNLRWRHFIPNRLAKRVATLIAEVERDQYGVFWG